jgi:hypothetical protein
MMMAFCAGSASAETVKVLAAGSLRAALGEVVETFAEQSGTAVTTDFAPSGLLRDRILGGEAADDFASANLEHPRAIAAERGGDELRERDWPRGLSRPHAQPCPIGRHPSGRFEQGVSRACLRAAHPVFVLAQPVQHESLSDLVRMALIAGVVRR